MVGKGLIQSMEYMFGARVQAFRNCVVGRPYDKCGATCTCRPLCWWEGGEIVVSLMMAVAWHVICTVCTVHAMKLHIHILYQYIRNVDVATL